jgi:predicted Zn-dependent protease
MDRRHFLMLSAGATTGLMLTGCATNPVTGKSQFMLMTEDGEIQLDRQQSPHQFSADFGPSRDIALNNYVSRVGLEMGTHTHRPHMPYSFRVVNSPRFNAYTFPGGSAAVTRGILLGMDDEAELAAVLGHELGHVNARHGAERMSKGLLTQLVVAGIATGLASDEDLEEYAPLAAGLGNIAGGALLAHYSRNDEREADALGMQYMVAQGLNPQGMVGLMDALRKEATHNPHVIELMFATHPMTEERYQTAQQKAESAYQHAKGLPRNRERFMDNTAELRRIRRAIEAMQRGDTAMAARCFEEARNHYSNALHYAPNDYAGLLLMANCCQALNRPADAAQYAQRAQQVYPSEPQACFSAGMAALHLGQYDRAQADFARYEQMLPGNPNLAFWQGFALEGSGRQQAAATQYAQYLQQVQQGNQAGYAWQKLVDWGYLDSGQ